MQPKQTPESIVQRLQRRIEQAQELGFQVRHEWLDGLESTWCELGGVNLLFLDVSKTVAEQLSQVDGAIAWLREQNTAQVADGANLADTASGQRAA